ncbi:MAG: peptidylprolyl isomerase [Akkermansiaceae bacterium]|nr:peptidylprolyl isomerase [Akkermansiaceae bacterium]
MKIRFLTSLVSLCVLSIGLQAQDENQEPAEPVEAPKPATPAPADPPRPATPQEPAGDTPPPATPPPVAPPAPAEDPALKAPEDVAAPPADAGKSESGLAWKVLKQGTGTAKPGPTTKVEVHYTGWKTDGEMFDSSVKRGQPTTFPLNGVIKGWTEGLQLMVEGEKRRFWIPADLAYGENPGGGRPGGMLCFDVELLNILRPHPTPENVAAPPEDAIKTASGLATQVVKAGNGEIKPKPLDNVRVHYTLWTTDGKMVASSLADGRPATFPLKRTIKGFTEALQMMVEGESRRIWIPEDLAYGVNPPETAPKGMLVFEVELLKIYSN